MPKGSRAIATTLPAAPAPFVPLYTSVGWRERVPVTTVVRDLDGCHLVASGHVERNHYSAISRKRAPNLNLHIPQFADATVYSV
jgi:hypothetical protein